MSADVPQASTQGLFYPDISAGQGAMDLSGVDAVCIKRSEGTYYLNPQYAAQVAQAKKAGAFYFAYHFLTNEDPKAQAQFCYDNVGPDVGVMVDVETQNQTGSKPTLAQNVAFVENLRGLGGIVHLNYLPQWYWSSVWGSPGLTSLKDLGLALVSSDYTSYQSGAGWAPYGGWTPTIWQYSDSTLLNGVRVDFNAFLGSGPADPHVLTGELETLVRTGKLPAARTWQEWDTLGRRSLQQIAVACDMTPAAVLRATAIHFDRYDPVTHDYLDQVLSGTLPATAKIPAGGRLWVQR
jgi:Glycosyl hydrolases family 25